MVADSTHASASPEDALRDALRHTGAPEDFWRAYLAAVCGACDGEWAVVASYVAKQWRVAAAWPSESLGDGQSARVARCVAEFAKQADGDAGLALCLPDESGRSQHYHVVAPAATGEQAPALLVLGTDTAVKKVACERLARLRLCALLVDAYSVARAQQNQAGELRNFAATLDLMVLVNAEDRFLASALTLCNELASRTGSQRVSLGWCEGREVRLRAISHTEKFERKMSGVREIEGVLDECLDQDEELIYPPPPGRTTVVRQLEQFLRANGADYAVAMPIRFDGEPVAALLCERREQPYDDDDIRLLRLVCDQAARPLADLQRHDRWLGSRLLAYTRDKLGLVLGVRHTFAKLAALVVCAGLVFLTLVQRPFRIEAPFTVKGRNVVFVPAPLDGYIAKAACEPGDEVGAGDFLLSLDTRELVLEEAAAQAELFRRRREVEKARGESALAEMRIAAASVKELESRLGLIRHRLAQAVVQAPFAGVVVEGDLRERVGSPVRKGDVLIKLAQLDQLHFDLAVDERDIHFLTAASTGELAFASQPAEKFAIAVAAIEPSAQASDAGNAVTVRCAAVADSASWWRPGMTGVAKIDCGQRTLLWIFSRRTVDFLRLLLWF